MDRLFSATWAQKITAMARWSVEPSRLNEYPIGITNAAISDGTPYLFMFSIALGRADSEELVANPIKDGPPNAQASSRSGNRQSTTTGTRTIKMNRIKV